MDTAHELFSRIRLEIFDAESLAEFGRRLGYDKSHIHRMEKGEAPIRAVHVGLCRQLRVPPERKAALEAILAKLEVAVAAEERARLEAKKDSARKTRSPPSGPLAPPEPDPAWLQSWEAAVTYLGEAEADAEWFAAVQYLQEEENREAARKARKADEEAARYRRQTRFLIGAALSVAAVAVVVLTVSLSSGGTFASSPPKDVYADQEDSDIGEKKGGRRPIPPKPLPEQHVGPCDKVRGEVLKNGGCWYGPRDTGGEPCGPQEYEDAQGRCYLPVRRSKDQPRSIGGPDGGTPDGGFGHDGGTPWPRP